MAMLNDAVQDNQSFTETLLSKASSLIWLSEILVAV